jgi:segregation and condensation protein B
MDREEHAGLAGDIESCSCVAELEPPVAADDAPWQDEPAAESAPAIAAKLNGEATPAQIIEALLFSSDTPLSLNRLSELVGERSTTQIRLHIADLNDKYTAAGLSFRIEEIARGYQMMTQPRFKPWLARLVKQQAQTRLSGAALETLSIVAYKQPVIRADIEAIRGVACGEVLNRLREMGLVRIVGRAEIVGRPMLYGTTRKFLDTFGLADLDDLPPMEMLSLRRRDSMPEPELSKPPSPESTVGATAVSAVTNIPHG